MYKQLYRRSTQHFKQQINLTNKFYVAIHKYNKILIPPSIFKLKKIQFYSLTNKCKIPIINSIFNQGMIKNH